MLIWSGIGSFSAARIILQSHCQAGFPIDNYTDLPDNYFMETGIILDTLRNHRFIITSWLPSDAVDSLINS